MARYFVIASPAPVALDSEEEVAAYFAKNKGDVSAFTIVKGVALVPRMQLSLMPASGAKPERKPRKEPPLPDEDVLKAIVGLYSDGKGRSKRVAREALSGLGVDKVDGCIDWMAHTGRLSVVGKTYTIVKE